MTLEELSQQKLGNIQIENVEADTDDLTDNNIHGRAFQIPAPSNFDWRNEQGGKIVRPVQVRSGDIMLTRVTFSLIEPRKLRKLNDFYCLVTFITVLRQLKAKWV